MHATAVILGDRGILIVGASGSGKTTLALTLLEHGRRNGIFTRLVADDQVFLCATGGRLLCRAPSPIAGLVEVHGLGPRAIEHETRAVIDFVVKLVPAESLSRMQDKTFETLSGCAVPSIETEERNAAAAVQKILARLLLWPFV